MPQIAYECIWFIFHFFRENLVSCCMQKKCFINYVEKKTFWKVTDDKQLWNWVIPFAVPFFFRIAKFLFARQDFSINETIIKLQILTKFNSNLFHSNFIKCSISNKNLISSFSNNVVQKHIFFSHSALFFLSFFHSIMSSIKGREET